MNNFDKDEYRAALRARDRAAAFHLQDPNVNLIDVGLKIIERAGKKITSKPTVRVHLRRKLRGKDFETFAANHPERVVDEGRIGFPVDIIQADYLLHWHVWSQPRTLPGAQGFNTLQGGISISNEWAFNFGTLGGLVEDRITGDIMILSNWHVLAGSPHAPKGLGILQPGYGDSRGFPQTVAFLERHAMDEGLDAAVATLSGSRSWANHQLGIGPVAGESHPWPGMRVTKAGRTSEVTEGIVTGVEGEKWIPYGRFGRLVRHIVHIAQGPEMGEVSAPGDSGSWWLEASTNRAAGLHFAGDNDPEYGLAVSMPAVLDALQVDIATGSGLTPSRPALTPQGALVPAGG